MKQNIEFYPHYATADQHAKFKMLRVQLGWEGEGKFWALNNRIALSEGCCLDISKKYNKAALAGDLNFTLDEFDKFIIFLKDDCELIKECGNGTITTDIIQEVFAKVMQDRDKARERHRRTSGGKSKTSGEKIHRVKESKVKETKEDKKIYKRKKSPKQTSLPSSFPVTERMREYAEQKNYIADLEDLTEAFLIHHKSKGSYFSCWHSAWQTWLRNQLDWYPEKNVPKGQLPSLKLQPRTYAQAQDAERRQRNKWLLKEMENERTDAQNNSAGNIKAISELPES